MSDLKEFKAAIDGIEVSEQQKRKMYSNIIEKAETKKKGFSLPSLALRFAPVLSFCLVAVITGSLLLNQSKSFDTNSKEIDYQNPVSDVIQPSDDAPGANTAETSEDFEIDGIVYTVTVRDLQECTDVSVNDSSLEVTVRKAFAISWTEDGMVFTLSSEQVADEESLLKARDKVMELFYQKD
ncbi:MAG: hypothetical protein K6A14_02525 [Erysipelotrichaceae bacterium]|nr:hypothetical protein [Erysipelotrichaceae bacterium]